MTQSEIEKQSSTLDRRSFLSSSVTKGLAVGAIGTSGSLWRSLASAADGKTPKRVLLRSSWQTVNIGDIAHTPGVLSILREHLPDVEVTLWPSNVDNGVEALLRKEFPKLKIAKPRSEELKRAFRECDFLLHGSGASIVAERDLVRWREETGKPYGIYGITFPMKKSSATTARNEEAMARSVEVLSQARFVFFRDSKSLELAKSLGASAPVMEFGPTVPSRVICEMNPPRIDSWKRTNWSRRSFCVASRDCATRRTGPSNPTSNLIRSSTLATKR